MKTLILINLLLLGTTLLYAHPAPRKEHPRPDFRRDAWLTLNGTWDFQFDPQNEGVHAHWYQPGKHTFLQKIVVPYPWESKLSGVNRPDYKGIAWYRRTFKIPKNWQGKAVFLRLGAVDWEAKIWVNGKPVGTHEGGYTPFEFEITPFLKPGTNNLVIRAVDWTNPSHPVGKQVNWYTHTSGIWQTVWLEARDPEIFLQNFRFYPDADNGRVKIELEIKNAGPDQEARVALISPDGDFTPLKQSVQLERGITKQALVISTPDPKLWSPEHPALYNLDIQLSVETRLADCVHTYFGLRKISVQAIKGKAYTYVFLNNKPIYLRGALDQSFTPEGIYTFRTDADIRRDIEKAKEFGLNFLRIHIKVDDPRLIYWADKLGLLLMYDMPSTWAYDSEARRTWELTAKAALQRDFNHPSIFAWVLFNETWGLHDPQTGTYTPAIQDWVKRQVHFFKQADPTRLVEDNSPCNYDHVATDINSWHFYINDYARARAHIQKVVDHTFPGSTFNFISGVQGDQPLMNSEYGGISAGMGDQDISWCFKFLTNELRRHDKISGYIYTELMDIEWERNGYLNYDRTPKTFGYDAFFPGMRVADLNALDFVGFDSPPCPTRVPGSLWKVPVFFSHFSGKPLSDATLRWELRYRDRFGTAKTFGNGNVLFHPKSYGVISVDTLHISLPQERCLGTLRLRVEDSRGRVLAKNYVNVDVTGGSLPRQEKCSDSQIAVRFLPSDFTKQKWEDFENDPRALGSKIAGLGSGFVTYEIPVPAGVSLQKVKKMELLFEGAARAGSVKVNARFEKYPWTRFKPADYPQTDVTKFPSDVTILVNGVRVDAVRFEDDPADARGVLSHKADFQRGSYGYLTRVEIVGRTLQESLAKIQAEKLRITFQVPNTAKNRGGFSLYGEKMGRFPVDPTVIFFLAK